MLTRHGCEGAHEGGRLQSSNLAELLREISAHLLQISGLHWLSAEPACQVEPLAGSASPWIIRERDGSVVGRKRGAHRRDRPGFHRRAMDVHTAFGGCTQ